MTVRFVAHACIAIEHEGSLLLTDPWLDGKIFNDSWALADAPGLATADLARIRHIVISHEHPDHLHFPTLRRIRDRVSGPLTAYYRAQKNSNVREAIRKIGIEVVELGPREECLIAPGLSVTNFPCRQDAAQVFRLGDRVLLNQNDCRPLPDDVRALNRAFPRIDLWFFQFSLAGYYANEDDHAGLLRAKASHLRLIGEYFEAFRPAIFVPYASFVLFCKETNAFMNRWAVGLDEVIAAFPEMPVQVLRPGDAVLWQDWTARNRKNLDAWAAVPGRSEKIHPHPPVEEARILQAANALVREGVSRELRPFRPPETQLEIRETGHALAIDFRRGRAAIIGRAERKKRAGVLPAETLLYFLRHAWGADTLNITACFRVTDARRWRRLLRFRHTLYLGTEKDAWRERGATWLLGRLARGVVNRLRAILFDQSA
ncbi:MAG: MBL fold metallo-hydrolase [Myxococcota bacterium]